MTPTGILIGLGFSVAALAGGLLMLVTGGSERDALFLLILSLAAFGLTAFQAMTAQKRDGRIDAFPGPLALSAPAWQRGLLCAACLAVAFLIFFGGVRGKAGTSDDWEFYRMVVTGAVAFITALGGLGMLARRTLTLDAEGLRYHSIWGTYDYRWRDFSKFYVGGGSWNWVVCKFSGQQRRSWLIRRGLMITMPLGISKRGLSVLLTEWQAKALAGQQPRPAPAMAQRGSLLDYA